MLLAIVQLTGDGYGVPIVDEIERRTGRSVARAAVYVTLRRLESKGLISPPCARTRTGTGYARSRASWMGEPTAERGGKARRLVKIEPEGLRLLQESRQALDQMWSGLDSGITGAR